MTKITVTVAACATLLWAGAALATPTPQQNCDNARITAWKVYTSCIDSVVAKHAKGVIFDSFAAFAKCRHAYFKKWTAFQTKASLAGSTCIGSRFVVFGAVFDNLTGLIWEQKTTDSSVHDEGNTYTWSTGAPWFGNGTAFTTFLTGAGTGLNVAGFGGANDWRLPTLAELQTILLDFRCTGAGGGPTCSCGSLPCIDLTFGPTPTFGIYWSATSYVPDPNSAWVVEFDGIVTPLAIKNFGNPVRAVRGGL